MQKDGESCGLCVIMVSGCVDVWMCVINQVMLPDLSSGLPRFSNVCRLRIIGASVSEPHLGSSTRPLSVSLSVCLSIYIYIYHTSVIFGPAAPALRANVSRLI